MSNVITVVNSLYDHMTKLRLLHWFVLELTGFFWHIAGDTWFYFKKEFLFQIYWDNNQMYNLVNISVPNPMVYVTQCLPAKEIALSDIQGLVKKY